MINSYIAAHADHVANDRFEEARRALHIITTRPTFECSEISAKLRFAADFLDAQTSNGDIPGNDVVRLIDRCGEDIKTRIVNLQLQND